MSTFTAEQIALQQYIQQENAEARAAGACMLTTDDLDHWARSNVTNIEQYKHHCAEAAFVDLYKELENFKPRWIDFSAMTTDQIWAAFDDLVNQKERAEAAEKARLAELAELNRYRPNLAFAELGNMMSA